MEKEPAVLWASGASLCLPVTTRLSSCNVERVRPLLRFQTKHRWYLPRPPLACLGGRQLSADPGRRENTPEVSSRSSAMQEVETCRTPPRNGAWGRADQLHASQGPRLAVQLPVLQTPGSRAPPPGGPVGQPCAWSSAPAPTPSPGFSPSLWGHLPAEAQTLIFHGLMLKRIVLIGKSNRSFRNMNCLDDSLFFIRSCL